MSNFTVINRETINGTINGCTYAPKVHVLARTVDRMLIWVPGHNFWSGMHGKQYAGTAMRALRRNQHGIHDTRICEGERLKASVFVDHAKEIDEIFGDGFHKLLDPQKTLVVGDNPPFHIHGNEMPVTGREFGYGKLVRQQAARERLEAQGVTGIELHLRSQQEADDAE